MTQTSNTNANLHNTNNNIGNSSIGDSTIDNTDDSNNNTNNTNNTTTDSNTTTNVTITNNTVITETEWNYQKQLVGEALRQAFLQTDSQLIEYCKAKGGLDYASSTGVVMLTWGRNNLSIAHVGDSRGCIGKVSNDQLTSYQWLTVDHKPDQPLELQRIQSSGGSLVYLHGSKPFIRGGDFLVRQQQGEHPKQVCVYMCIIMRIIMYIYDNIYTYIVKLFQSIWRQGFETLWTFY